MTLFSGVAPQAAVTASQISRAKSSSVAVKVSGLYSSTHCVSGWASANSRIRRTDDTAMSTTCSLLTPKTFSRKGCEVAL